MSCEEILSELKSLANPENVEGMAKFGINPHKTLGVPVKNLRRIAKTLKKDHELAQELWQTGIHEARILASIIDEPKEVTAKQMEEWVSAFDSWDVCDQCCINLFRKTQYAYSKAVLWTAREEEFVKRAGFSMIATLAVHDKKADDQVFIDFLPLIKREAVDPRNYVKKAVNWALRQIGKRNKKLNSIAIQVAWEIKEKDSKSARWIANDAIRDLEKRNAY